MKIRELLRVSEGENIYFVSDLHYNHANSIKYGNRQFSNVSEMNNHIVEELKTRLTSKDILFDLGDLFWKTKDEDIINILDQIPCKNIYKIMGNHDSYEQYFNNKRINKLFKGIYDILDVNIVVDNTTYQLSLCHYPIVSWNHKPYGSLNIHGHCHGNIDDYNESNYDLRVDIGFDSKLSKELGTFIISIKDIINYFDRKTNGLSYLKWVNDNKSLGRL